MVQRELKTSDVGPPPWYRCITVIYSTGKSTEALSCRASYIRICREPCSGKACRVWRKLPRGGHCKGDLSKRPFAHAGGWQWYFQISSGNRAREELAKWPSIIEPSSHCIQLLHCAESQNTFIAVTPQKQKSADTVRLPCPGVRATICYSWIYKIAFFPLWIKTQLSDMTVKEEYYSLHTQGLKTWPLV